MIFGICAVFGIIYAVYVKISINGRATKALKFNMYKHALFAFYIEIYLVITFDIHIKMFFEIYW